MKIVVIGPVYPFRGGIAHSNTLLCSNLSKNHDVVVLSFKRLYPKILFPGKAQKYEVKRKFDIKVEHIIDSVNPFNWLGVFLKIKKSGPDLIILQWWTTFLAPFSFTLLWLIRHFTKIKVCIYCQSVLPLERRSIDALPTKAVFSQTNYFVVLSKLEKKQLHEFRPKAKVKVMVEPTYEVQFSEKIPKMEAKRKLGLKGNVALFFGFVRPYKGLQYLIKAMPSVLREVDITLLVVGEFWGGKEKYTQEIKKLGLAKNIKIIDKYIPDEKVNIYFSAADVCVLPYLYSTQSGILQVAFGYNVPVITTKVGSLVDLVKDSKTGYLVRPKNAKELSRAIITYFNHNKEGAFVKAIKKEKKTFEWGKEKEKILFHGLK